MKHFVQIYPICLLFSIFLMCGLSCFFSKVKTYPWWGLWTNWIEFISFYCFFFLNYQIFTVFLDMDLELFSIAFRWNFLTECQSRVSKLILPYNRRNKQNLSKGTYNSGDLFQEAYNTGHFSYENYNSILSTSTSSSGL